jgi:hypothetical protein
LVGGRRAAVPRTLRQGWPRPRADQEDIRAWQRSLLPGALLDEREGDAPARSTRDRVVDVTLMLLAVAVGLALLADTWEEHVSPEHRFADGALGVVAAWRWGGAAHAPSPSGCS